MDEAHLSTPENSRSFSLNGDVGNAGSRLTYFVPALTATITEASNVVNREALNKGGGSGDITVYTSQSLRFESLRGSATASWLQY